MASRTLAPAPTDGKMWRKLLLRPHPDQGGSEDLFVWVRDLQEHVAGDVRRGTKVYDRREDRRGDHRSTPYATVSEDRIPYDPQLGFVDDFIDLTMRGLSIGKREEEPYHALLDLLLDCPAANHGRRAERQCRGASYKQLAAIGHRFGMSKADRCRWYEIARSMPLSEAHASHILSSF